MVRWFLHVFKDLIIPDNIRIFNSLIYSIIKPQCYSRQQLPRWSTMSLLLVSDVLASGQLTIWRVKVLKCLDSTKQWSQAQSARGQSGMVEYGGIYTMKLGMLKCSWKPRKYSGNLNKRQGPKCCTVVASYTWSLLVIPILRNLSSMVSYFLPLKSIEDGQHLKYQTILRGYSPRMLELSEWKTLLMDADKKAFVLVLTYDMDKGSKVLTTRRAQLSLRMALHSQQRM